MRKLHIVKRLRLAGLLVIGTAITLFSSTQAHAEYFGFPTGRSAKISSLPASSIEAGFVTGDVGGFSYQGAGVRFNYRTSTDFMIYLDAVRVDSEDAEGMGYGVGFFYHIPGILKKNDFAAKVSYHIGYGNAVSIEGVFSGQKIGASNLSWYTNVGLHKFDLDNGYDESELGFGAGVFTDTSFGEFYAGIDLIDEITFGFGVRYHL